MPTIIRLNLFGRYVPNNQELVNRHFYLFSDEDAVLKDDLEELNAEFISRIGTAARGISSADVQYDRVESANDTTDVVAITPYAAPNAGTWGFSSELPFYVMKYKLQRNASNVRSGNKFYSGVVANLFDAVGAPTDATWIANSAILEARLNELYTLPSTRTAVPMLAHNYSTATGLAESFAGIASVLFDGLSTQRSRKAKRTPS